MGTEQTIQLQQNALFPLEVRQMPAGYYAGDQPNPNLRAFVEVHLAERPYNPEHDDYDVPAFNKPIETTKATAIYNMHTYWSKKPHDAIRQYIEHYTQPGDLVLANSLVLPPSTEVNMRYVDGSFGSHKE